MKDPTLEEDPRLVPAFAVYKGLNKKLKTYQESNDDGASTSKRNKKKAKKRKRQEESPGLEKKAVPKFEVKKRADSASSNNVENQDGQASSGKKKRKRKNKKNKKQKANGDASEADTTVPLDTTVDLSDDDIAEPPTKARKTNNNMVPNPLAAKPQTPGKKVASPVNGTTPSKVKKQKMDNGAAVASGKQRNTPSSSTSSSQNGSPAKALKKDAKKASPASSTSGPSSSKSQNSKLTHTVTSKVPPVDIKSIFNSKKIEDSVSHAKAVLEWLLHPVSSDEFMSTYWEKKPLFIKRKHGDAADYYKWILTTQTLDDMLRRHPIKYGVNLDITSYVDGKRETLSETMHGRVRPAVVWDYYNNGCSIRMLNPQTYTQPLWRINSSLQEWFGSFVGANMYLTPPDSQGFAPHYDDIDAFILQIEGKKRWKLYAARNEDEKLARFSSGNFSEETDGLGEPIFDAVLEEGNLLYFPRGVIHQAQTVDGEHSLHITLSCNQLNTYGDLLKHHLNHALEKLMAKDVNFRKGLPVDYLSFMGIAHANTTDKELQKKRATFSKTMQELVGKIAKEPADFAADGMGKKFIWDSLPPCLNSKERETTVVEDGEFMQNGKVFNRVEFGPETEIKFIRKNCVRLVVEDEQIKLYFNTENPLVYHEEEEPQYLEVSVELAPAINHLISQYPKYTKIEELPISSNDTTQTLQLAADLWERGLLFTKDPLEPCDYDDFESDSSEHEEGSDEKEGNNKNEDDVESINLSDLAEESGDETQDFIDDFYDATMGLGVDSDGSEDDDEDGDLFVYSGEEDDDEEDDSDSNAEDNGMSLTSYLIGEGEDPEFDDDDDDFVAEDDEDDDDYDDEEEIDIDELDRMGESDSE